MNLQEWINYNKNCPLCQAPLTTYLHSSKRQSIKWEEGRMVVIFPLLAKNRGGGSTDYKVGYSFSLTDNDFCIEFYNKDGLRIEKDTAFHLMDKFKDLNENLKSYRFYRRCNSCLKYHYSSGIFKLDFRNSRLHFKEDFIVSSEYFGLIQAMEKGNKYLYRIYRLLNCYTKKEYGSHLTFWGDNDPHGSLSDRTVPNGANYLDLPLIPFISPEDTLERIKKLLVFS